MMLITSKWLKQKSACIEGIKWFEAQKETEDVKVLKQLIKEDKLHWANWLIVRIMDYKQRVQYAVFAAEQVIHIFEKKHPDDKRPRQAIEAAKKCIDNPSKENKAAAYAAATANAAYAATTTAAYAAAATATAAYAATATAAYAAATATAAYAATATAAYAAATATAAYAATATAAYAALRIKILKYGLKLINQNTL